MGLQIGPSLVFTRELILREGLCQCYECGFDFMLHFFLIIEVNMIYNVVLVSGVQQSDSVIHIHICILLQILFPYIPIIEY